MTENPMETLKLLRKRVAEITADLGVNLVNFLAIPDPKGGPDHIACTWEVTPNAVKSSEEIEHDRLEDDFMSILGDIDVVTDEYGNVVLAGGDDAPDEMTEQDRKEAEERRAARLEKIRRLALEGEDNDG